MFNFGTRKINKQGRKLSGFSAYAMAERHRRRCQSHKDRDGYYKTPRIAPATPCKDAASAFTVFLLFAKIVLCHVLNMLFSTLTSLSNVFMGLSAVLLSGKVYKTICTINFKVILMGGVIGPAEMERIRKNREKKKKSQ